MTRDQNGSPLNWKSLAKKRLSVARRGRPFVQLLGSAAALNDPRTAGLAESCGRPSQFVQDSKGSTPLRSTHFDSSTLISCRQR